MVTPSHDQDTPIVAEKHTPLEAALICLDPAWIVLADLEIGTSPRSITADYVLLHGALGIALIDLVPGHKRDPSEAFRRFLNGERFTAFFPGFLPLVRLIVAPSETAIEKRLLAAFSALPPLAIADPEWAEAVNSLLVSPDPAETQAPAPPERPERDEAPPEPPLRHPERMGREGADRERIAPERIAPERIVPERLAPERIAPGRIAIDETDGIAVPRQPDRPRAPRPPEPRLRPESLQSGPRLQPNLRGPASLPPSLAMEPATRRRWPAVVIVLAALIGGGAGWLSMSASDSDSPPESRAAVVPLPPPIDPDPAPQDQASDMAPQSPESSAQAIGDSIAPVAPMTAPAPPLIASPAAIPEPAPAAAPAPAVTPEPAPPIPKPDVAQAPPPAAEPSQPLPPSFAGSTEPAPATRSVETSQAPAPQAPTPVVPPTPATDPAKEAPAPNSIAAAKTQAPQTATPLQAAVPPNAAPAPSNAPSGAASTAPQQSQSRARPKPVKATHEAAPPRPVARTGPPIDAADLPPLDAADLPRPIPTLPPAPAAIGSPSPGASRRPVSLLQHLTPSDGSTPIAAPVSSGSASGTVASGSPASGNPGDISVSALDAPAASPPAAAPAQAAATAVAAGSSSDPDKRVCRIYNMTKTIQGKAQPITGLACRTPDGQWQLVTEGPAQ